MNSNLAYYQQRAEAELQMAQRATDPAVGKAHYQMAGFYLDRIHGDGEDAPLSAALSRTASALRGKAEHLLAELEKVGVVVVRPPS